MIGNDLICLPALRSYAPDRWQAWWQKVLQPAEWARFPAQANDPQAWLYWAAKESAWKAWFRRSGLRRLNPKAFAVQDVCWYKDEARFVVQGPDACYEGAAVLGADFLYAVVCERGKFITSPGPSLKRRGESISYFCPLERRGDGIADFPSLSRRGQGWFSTSHITQQARPESSILPILAARLNVPPAELKLGQQNGVPILYHHDQPLPIPLSKSHHGPWTAYAYVYPLGT